MASIVILTLGWLINAPVTTVSIGINKDASIYENLGKLLVAETTIVGTSKLDFISKNIKTLASTVGVKEKDIWILYSELAILHGEYLKKKSESATDHIGYK